MIEKYTRTRILHREFEKNIWHEILKNYISDATYLEIRNSFLFPVVDSRMLIA